jgi:hypothetical protein
MDWPEHTPPPSINVQAIDGQHAVLMGNVERLERAMADGQEAAALPQILEELKAYAAYHGPLEERLMEAYGYPLRDLHATLAYRAGSLWPTNVNVFFTVSGKPVKAAMRAMRIARRRRRKLFAGQD